MRYHCHFFVSVCCRQSNCFESLLPEQAEVYAAVFAVIDEARMLTEVVFLAMLKHEQATLGKHI